MSELDDDVAAVVAVLSLAADSPAVAVHVLSSDVVAVVPEDVLNVSATLEPAATVPVGAEVVVTPAREAAMRPPRPAKTTRLAAPVTRRAPWAACGRRARREEVCSAMGTNLVVVCKSRPRAR